MWVGHEVIPSRLSIMSEEKVKKGGDNEVGMVISKEESEWNQ